MGLKEGPEESGMAGEQGGAEERGSTGARAECGDVMRPGGVAEGRIGCGPGGEGGFPVEAAGGAAMSVCGAWE